MEKKLTKKEQKELQKALEQDAQNRAVARYRYIDELRSFWKDVSATERYLTINNKKITEDEKERLFKRYKSLSEYPFNPEKNSKYEHIWSINRFLENSNNIYNNFGYVYNDNDKEHELNDYFGNDCIYISDIIWDENEANLLVELAKKFGYTKIFYFSSSSSTLNVLCNLINVGCRVERPTSYGKKYVNNGLIISIPQQYESLTN